MHFNETRTPLEAKGGKRDQSRGDSSWKWIKKRRKKTLRHKKLVERNKRLDGCKANKSEQFR